MSLFHDQTRPRTWMNSMDRILVKDGIPSPGWLQETPRRVPTGEHTKNYGKIHHFQWENSLFLWPFSIAMLNYQRVFTIVTRIQIQVAAVALCCLEPILRSNPIVDDQCLSRIVAAWISSPVWKAASVSPISYNYFNISTINSSKLA